MYSIVLPDLYSLVTLITPFIVCQETVYLNRAVPIHGIRSIANLDNRTYVIAHTLPMCVRIPFALSISLFVVATKPWCLAGSACPMYEFRVTDKCIACVHGEAV